jgi:AAA+ ATPase superfamily predicted ATPase
MNIQNFIGRKTELERLSTLHKKKTPNLVVVKGRRRIGKSRLINSFASSCSNNKFWSFAGLVPENGVNDQSQRDNFARQLATHLKLPPFTFQDWTDAFNYLTQHVKSGDIILFDEISWMGSKDTSFVPKLKAWWDEQKIPIMVVFCGSVSTWIEENILKSTAFFGRVNLTITLDPLPINDAKKLLNVSGFKGSDYEIFKILSILGGIPWYLEQIAPGQTADDFIKQLCFEKDGLLVLEFDRIFHDLFSGKGVNYIKILNCLKDGMKTLAEIRSMSGFPHSGTLSSYIEHLIVAGFVSKQNLWSFKTHKPLKQSLYRISDPYMRFYLKLIEPQRNKINLNNFHQTSISNLPGFESHLGLQMEQLLLQNRNAVIKSIGIDPADIVDSGSYRQMKSTMKAGCQIDFLIQTRTNNIFVCEFKFKRRELGVEIISEVQNKIQSLQVPKGFAVIPVLFHIGGVSSNLDTSDYFFRIVDISDFLIKEN